MAEHGVNREVKDIMAGVELGVSVVKGRHKRKKQQTCVLCLYPLLPVRL